jgi:hypothetical protein
MHPYMVKSGACSGSRRRRTRGGGETERKIDGAGSKNTIPDSACHAQRTAAADGHEITGAGAGWKGVGPYCEGSKTARITRKKREVERKVRRSHGRSHANESVCSCGCGCGCESSGKGGTTDAERTGQERTGAWGDVEASADRRVRARGRNKQSEPKFCGAYHTAQRGPHETTWVSRVSLARPATVSSHLHTRLASTARAQDRPPQRTDMPYGASRVRTSSSPPRALAALVDAARGPQVRGRDG